MKNTSMPHGIADRAAIVLTRLLCTPRAQIVHRGRFVRGPFLDNRNARRTRMAQDRSLQITRRRR